MKKTRLATALAAALCTAGSVQAATLEERLQAMEKRLQYLEQRVQVQDKVIREKDEQISELSKSSRTESESARSWVDNIEVGGLIEVEANHASADGGEDTSDAVTATVELAIAAQVNDWVGAELVLKYEEETDNDDGSGDGSEFDVDTAVVTIADPDGNWFVNAGQYTLPFGVYETNMVADPLTLDLGETLDSAIEAGIGFGPVTASVYTFQGDRDDEIDNFGLALNLETEANGVGISGHLGYLNDLGETDGIGDIGFITNDEDVAAWTASAGVSVGAFSFIAEYVAALDGFDDAAGDEPSAFNLEVGYAFAAAGKPATFAVAYQGTDEMENIDPGISEKRVGATVAVEIFDNTVIALEYRNDEDYDGVDTDTISGKLAVEF